MTSRYHLAGLPIGGGSLSLPPAESHHAATVMRVRCGDRLTLFDGQGHEAEATIVSVSKREVRLTAEPAVYRPRENRRAVTLAVAMPKGDRARELVERLTELGIDRLVPLHCERSPWAVSAAALAKWQRVAVEACKQCGRNRLMEIEEPQSVAEQLGRPLADGEIGWFAHPGGGEMNADSLGERSATAIRVAIGPEGGFTEGEVAAARAAGWTPVGLGERIYRIETAAVIVAIHAAGI